MTPQELYNEIRAYDSTTEEKVLCDLHRPCDINHGGTRLCTKSQTQPVCDFDHVKVKFCSEHNYHPEWHSPDGVCVNSKNKRFFFVEIKSWKNVISPPNKPQISDTSTIDNKAAQYATALRNKWNDGQKICCEIVKDQDLFMEVPLALIFVTDIDTENDGVSSLAANINALAATTGSNLMVYCNEQMRDCLDTQLGDIPVYYIKCGDFDSKIVDY